MMKVLIREMTEPCPSSELIDLIIPTSFIIPLNIFFRLFCGFTIAETGVKNNGRKGFLANLEGIFLTFFVEINRGYFS